MPLGTLGKYERLDVLGHGISGIVYLAKDTLLNKQIALKEVDVQAGDMRRFLEEARVLDRLRHPNIVRVNNVDRIEGKVVIDMEYVRGQNLQNLLRAEGPLPRDRALDITAQVLDGLDYAHQMQTVHRDIKPANILVSRDGQVKLADFGLAEILATNAYAGGAGTYAYMAPEDFADENRSDHQSDLWAVGVTLFEMLTLQRPFHVARVKDPFAWKRAVENDLPVPLSEFLSDVPPDLQAALDRALTRNKRRRYQTASDFREDVLRVQAGQSIAPETREIGEEIAERRAEMSAPESVPDAVSHTGDGLTDLPRPLRSGPEVVVADVNVPDFVPDRAVVEAPSLEVETSAKRRMRLPFTRKPVETKLFVEPEYVDFGAVRKGELRSVKIQTRVQGLEGRVNGRVLHHPGWLTVHPTAFDRNKQTIVLTAHSARAWETGEFHETVRIETDAGTVDIPTRLMVLKPRPTFWQVAAWYVPLFAATLLPVTSLAFMATGNTAHLLASLVPTAAVASGLLAVMLLLICVAADTGLSEKIACGVLLAVMCFVLGATVARADTASAGQGLKYALVTGGLIGGVLLLQFLYLRRWKLWATALLLLSILIGGTFLQLLTG